MTAVVECSREAAFSENECEGRAPVQLVQCSTVYSDAAGSVYMCRSLMPLTRHLTRSTSREKGYSVVC